MHFDTKLVGLWKFGVHVENKKSAQEYEKLQRQNMCSFPIAYLSILLNIECW